MTHLMCETSVKLVFIKPFVPNAPFLYPLKWVNNLPVFASKGSNQENIRT